MGKSAFVVTALNSFRINTMYSLYMFIYYILRVIISTIFYDYVLCTQRILTYFKDVFSEFRKVFGVM